MQWYCHIVVLLCSVTFWSNSDATVMKIVNEVSNYGWNAQVGIDANQVKLKAKVKPSEFSGPSHFRMLNGSCFTFNNENYKYELCPFHNITQHERTLRWNPYSGLLGIWSEWEIENNTFISMKMRNGDDCGEEHRQTTVFFFCGNNNSISSVSEPSRCQYKINFMTPLVCHKDSMLVYPTLNQSLRAEWDQLEEDFSNKILTIKGYQNKLSRVFIKARLYIENKDDKLYKGHPTSFDSLQKCESNYLLLLQEIENLRQELQNKQC